MKSLVNLTNHPITLISEDGREIRIPPIGIELRALVYQRRIGDWNGVPIILSRFGGPAFPLNLLPGWDDGALYIVSSVTARAVQDYYPEHAFRFLVPGRTISGAGGTVTARALIASASQYKDEDEDEEE